MTLSREPAHGLAPLCDGIPDLAFTVTMAIGAQLHIAERPDASMCPHLYRQAVLAWPDAAIAAYAACLTEELARAASSRAMTLPPL